MFNEERGAQYFYKYHVASRDEIILFTELGKLTYIVFR